MINNKSKDDFINDANRVQSKISRKNPNNEDVLIMITGRKNKDIKSSPKHIYLRDDICDDIGRYCRGSFAPVVNFLIRKGLDKCIKDGVKICEEA